MTSTTSQRLGEGTWLHTTIYVIEGEPCGCGCGLFILPTDNHPWFKRPPCQALWQASLSQPEAEQSQWRSQQRLFATFLSVTPWERGWWDCEFELISVFYGARSVLGEHGRRVPDLPRGDWARINVEECLRVLAVNYARLNNWDDGEIQKWTCRALGTWPSDDLILPVPSE